MDLPLVTIGVPTFNGERYIRKTIESVLAQTYSNLEIIVIDDCSTDSTLDIVKALNDPRIKVIVNEKNMGPSGTWNRLIEHANGTYFKVLCHDDLLYEDIVRKQIDVLLKDECCVLVAANRDIIDESGNIAMSPKRFKKSGRIAGRKLLMKSIKSGTNIIGEPHAVMFRLDAIKKNNVAFGANFFMIDLDFYAQVLLHGDAYLIDETLSAFRVCSESSSYKMAQKQAEYFFEFVKNLRSGSAYSISPTDMARSFIMARFWQIAKIIYYRFH
ncbi:MAG: glycosyltransferase family 2 protein [Mucilaginibacter sp.]